MWDPPRKKKDCIKQSKISLIIIDDEKVENNFLKGQLSQVNWDKENEKI